ncbi:MAG: cobalt ECF transporter T component CbiQ [Thermodesulfovibrionales bacterium]
MGSFDTAFFNIGYLDRLSYRDTVIHRLDPRVKVITTVLFSVTVVSCPKYHVVPLIPFFAFPVLLAALSDTSFWFVMKKVLILSPFAVFIGIFNPLFDAKTVPVAYGIAVSAGWISFLSIIVKFILTISATLILIATTSFPGVCSALRKLGVPAPFISQLLFLYRYLFVMMEETMRIVRARDLRSFGTRGAGVTAFTGLVGTLFIRTIERAERIYNAMLCRGFQGDIFSLKQHHFRKVDFLFMLVTTLSFAFFRFVNVAECVGSLAQRFLV